MAKIVKAKVAPQISKKLFIFLVIMLFAVIASIYIFTNSNIDHGALYRAHPNDRSLKGKTASLNNKSKTLTVLTWLDDEDYLSRSGTPNDLELQYLKQFAKEKKLTFKKIQIPIFSDLIPALLEGKGDVISANLTASKSRKKQINFTNTLYKTHEYLLRGKKTKALKKYTDLNNRTVFIQKGKSYEQTAQALKRAYPKLKIKYFTHSLSYDEIYNKLASGEFDLTIQDGNLIIAALNYRNDIKRSLQVSKWRHIAWGIAPKNKKLLNELNTFLKAQQPNKSSSIMKKNESQWQHIKKTKIIRFVLRNNLSSYYIARGQLRGFHYELIKRFAKDYNLRYEIVVAPNNSSLLSYVVDGKADIALGFFTPTQKRRDEGIIFSIPYHYATELVIANVSHPSISSTSDLHGSDFYLRKSSSYWETALALKRADNTIHLHAISDGEDTEEIIKNVGLGKYSLTIADDHIFNIEMSFRDDIKSLISLGNPKSQGWAIKKGNNQLLRNVNNFVKKYDRSLFFNVIYNKYFKNFKNLKKQYTRYAIQNKTGRLSPYDKIVKKYALIYKFDWRILISQMHQESRFNPRAESMSGAEGLFQVMPDTAKELGINNIKNPEQGIKAGIAYMNWLRKRMHINEVHQNQLIWFTLASYNAGAGHVRDAMILAEKKKWDPDIWFNNVERAMLLLSNPKFADQARHGYVRGEEPVHYVRAIRLRYETYLNIEKAVSHINHIQKRDTLHSSQVTSKSVTNNMHERQ
ncbi:MAG: transporter substrate-binding domain-containing protein [Psychromonas sp.]|nr:transporter substrate-binding domain-containing protein [Psychromonas sp.]